MDPDKYNKKMFMNIMAQVCSRCFGWGLPTTAMVPMGDNINHAPASVINETINKRLHLEGDANSDYFCWTTFLNDYGTLYDKEEDKQNSWVRGSWNRDRHKKYLSEHNETAQTKAIEEGTPIWNVPFTDDNFSEDNDTSDEEEEPGFLPEDRYKEKGLRFLAELETRHFKMKSLTKPQTKDVEEDYEEKKEVTAVVTEKEGQPKVVDLTKATTKTEDDEENFRWWKHGNPDAYFVMVNCNREPMKAGD